jgi:hypothetical protein
LAYWQFGALVVSWLRYKSIICNYRGENQMSDEQQSTAKLNLLDEFPKEIKKVIPEIYDQVEFIFHLDGVAIEKLHDDLISHQNTKSKKKTLDSLLKTLRDKMGKDFSETIQGEFNNLMVQLKDIGTGGYVDSFKTEAKLFQLTQERYGIIVV